MKRSSAACLTTVASSLALLTTSACSSLRHVELPPPPPLNAAEPARVAYFNQHRPLAVAQGTGSQTTTGRAPEAFIQLHDGQRIVNVEDVLPVVGEGTVSGKAAMRARTLGDWSKVASVGGFVTSTVGLGIATAGTLTMYASWASAEDAIWRRNFDLGLPASVVGLAVGLVGVGVLLPAQWWGQEADLERTTALLTYEGSLRERVGLSVAPPTAPVPEPLPQ